MNLSVEPKLRTYADHGNSIACSNKKPLLVIENFQLLRSNVHGIGLFSLNFYPKGFEFGVAFVSGAMSYLYEEYLGDNYDKDADDSIRQLTAVRFVNHSLSPNLELYKPDQHFIFARCVRDIKIGEEITTDYRLAFPLFNEAIPTWVNAAS